MTRGIAALSVTVTLGAWMIALLIGLVFVPSGDWPGYVTAMTLFGGLGVIAATLLGRRMGEELARPLRRIQVAVEEDSFDQARLGDPEEPLPSEVAPLLRALRLTQARLRQSLSDLERDRGQMAAVFANMADGLLVLDGHERIAFSNRAALRLLDEPELPGRPLTTVSRSPELVELCRAATGSQPVVKMVELQRSPTASRVWVQVVATRLPDRRRLLLLQDVTELRRAEAARRDFVANVSHDLRTPIAALKALVETLEAGAMDDPVEGRDFLRRMHVEVDGLTQLVSELLALARIEAGRVDLAIAPTDVGALLEEAVDRLRPYAERLGLELTVAEAPLAESEVLADAPRIGQVLANLLSNAVKFTPAGGRIEVGARADGREVQFWVADTGIGIHRDNLSRVFERFYKADSARTGGGTGLGLAICKHLVLAHGGRVWAESGGEGRGSTFRFTLPRANPVGGPSAETPQVAPAAPAAIATRPAKNGRAGRGARRIHG